MIHKHPLRPDRLRHIPTGFNWVDHRLVRHGYFPKADPPAWSLYLFLLTVSDVQGLSYYSDAALSRHLKLDPIALADARKQLIQADLIAHKKPLYQILALPEEDLSAPPKTSRSGHSQSVADILRRALEGGAP